MGLSGTSLSKAQGPICSFLELVVIGLGIVVELGPSLTPPPSSVSSASDCCHLAALTHPGDQRDEARRIAAAQFSPDSLREVDPPPE